MSGRRSTRGETQKLLPINTFGRVVRGNIPKIRVWIVAGFTPCKAASEPQRPPPQEPWRGLCNIARMSATETALMGLTLTLG